MSKSHEPDKEILAITAVYAALKELDAPAQKRVIEYVLAKLNLPLGSYTREPDRESGVTPAVQTKNSSESIEEADKDTPEEEHDGISPVAQKWMRRNGLEVKHLSGIFSLGGDEIDLVAKQVPGKSTRARTHSVILLKGVAAYLGGGAARFTHEQLKETCQHYNAYDSPNFAKHLKEFASEVSGSKEAGFTLTTRGLTHATELVKQIAEAKKPDAQG